MDLLKYAEEIHENAKNKGLWKGGNLKGQMTMLMVSELGDALTAHRQNVSFYRFSAQETMLNIEDTINNQQKDDDFVKWFLFYAKGTYDDKIADVLIRIFDYVHGWGIPVIEREYRKESTGNLAHDLLRIVHYILQAFHDDVPGKDWGYVIAAIEAFCKWHNIEIEQFIRWKMRYNKTIPVKRERLINPK